MAYSSLITWVVRALMMAPVCRYVDDYFGCSRPELAWSGSACLQLLTMLVGTPCDPKKAISSMVGMVLLGAEILVDMVRQSVATRVVEKKARKWAAEIDESVALGSLSGSKAASMAGKLSFAATAARSRVGRAYLKPIYRQCRVPDGKLTWWTLMALQWWSAWLKTCSTQWSDVCRFRNLPHLH